MITTWIAYCLLVSALLGLAAFAGERALGHYRKPVRWAWVGAIVGSIVLPAAAFYAPALFRALSPVMLADAPILVLPSLTAPMGSAQVAGGVSPAAVSTLLGWAWGLSALFLGLHLAGTYRRLRGEMKGWTPGRILDSPVMMSPDRGPAVVGVRRSVIVMPQWIAELEDHLLRLVFLHEREHQQVGDHRLFALGIVALVLMPWNLFLWWEVRRLRLAIEFDCDHRVIGRGVDPRDYAEALLVVGSRVSGPLLAAAAFAERRPAVERRLRRMTEPLRRLRGPRAILAGGVGLLALVFACGSPLPTSPTEAERADVQAVETPQVDAVDPAESLPTPQPDDPTARPSFIPYDVPPVLQNSREIQQALVDKYPQDIRAAGIGGRAELWLYVDEEGRVANHEIKTSTGNLRLDEAAGEVVDGMRFSPAMNRDKATPVWVSQWIMFQTAGHTGGSSSPPTPALYVVDGVIQREGFDPRSLGQDAIESVEVIKGAEALRRYGDQARDGVVEITTKSGARSPGAPDSGGPQSASFLLPPGHVPQSGGPIRVIDADQDGYLDILLSRDGSPPVDFKVMSASERPLLVVDGVIQAASAGFPAFTEEDLDRIEFIKPPFSRSFYGRRAQEGVIQITTRSGAADVQR